MLRILEHDFRHPVGDDDLLYAYPLRVILRDRNVYKVYERRGHGSVMLAQFVYETQRVFGTAKIRDRTEYPESRVHVGNVMRIEIRVDRDVDFDLGILYALLSAKLRDASCEKFAVQVVSYLRDMTVLLSAEDIARTSDLEVAHRYLESAAEFGEIHYRGEAFDGVAREDLALLRGEIRVRDSVAPAHASS